MPLDGRPNKVGFRRWPNGSECVFHAARVGQIATYFWQNALRPHLLDEQDNRGEGFMEAGSTLRSKVVFGFMTLAMMAVVGFWRTYFSQLSNVSLHAHVHGIAMSLWLGLLIAQAYLIRSGHRHLHRQLGKASYLLVPVVVAATVSFAHARLLEEGLTHDRLYILYIQLHLLVLLILAYGFAIYWRRVPALHMRFMICTALPLIDPALSRIIENYLWIPSAMAYEQAITYSVTDLVLVVLIALNFRRELHLKVYPLMLAAFVALHIPNFLVADAPAWRSFAAWFASTPLW
jgi:hypothetical protein